MVNKETNERYKLVAKHHWEVFKPGAVEDFQSFLNEITLENIDFSKEVLIELFESLVNVCDTYALIIEELTSEDSP